MNKKLIKFVGPVVLLALIIITAKSFVYDEPYYFNNVKLIENLGFNISFLKNLGGPAGPLHAVLYFIVSKVITISKVLNVRVISFMLGIGSVYILSRVKQIKHDSLLLFACPVFYVCSGLALTESPAILFLAVGIYFFSQFKQMNLMYSIFAGILFSIAISGRQPILMLVPGIIISYIYCYILNKEYTAELNVKLILLILFSVIIPLYLFYIWGGIVPVRGGNIATQKPYDFVNGMLAFGYLSVFTFFMYPEFILDRLKKSIKLVVSMLVLGVVINFAFFKSDFYIMNSVANIILSPPLFRIYGLIGFGVLIGLSLISLFLIYDLFEVSKQNFFKLSCLIGMFLIVCTCFKVTHQFSSRYIYQSIVLLLPVMQKKSKVTNRSIAINLLGGLLGLMSFYSYVK